MDFRVLDREELDIPAWDNLVRNGSFFQTQSWAEICVDGVATEARSLFLCGYDRNRLAAGMPAIITSKYGMKSLYSMPDGTYGAPVFSTKNDPEFNRTFLDNLAKYLQAEKFSKVMIVDFEGRLSEWSEHSLNRSGYFTHLVSLEKPEQFRPHKKIEYDLRAGQNIKSEIIRIQSKSQVDEFYRLYRLTESRHGRKKPRYSKRFFESIFHHLSDSEMLYWTGMMAKGAMVGSQIHFIYGDMLFNWQTVSDYAARQYKPSQLLMNNAINHALKEGLKKVNLGASPPEAEGLIRYKERWHGRRVDYDILTARSGLRKMLGR
jgi:hypothetical protein